MSAWAEIDLVAYHATEQIGYGRRDKPVVGRLGPYSRVHFESGNARDVLASIGRVPLFAACLVLARAYVMVLALP